MRNEILFLIRLVDIALLIVIIVLNLSNKKK